VRILTLAPIAILAWLLARSPEVRMSIAGSPAGLGAVLAGAALNVAGRSWMGRIVSGAVQ
jgi:Flp pilus assembly protein TadB